MQTKESTYNKIEIEMLWALNTHFKKSILKFEINTYGDRDNFYSFKTSLKENDYVYSYIPLRFTDDYKTEIIDLFNVKFFKEVNFNNDGAIFWVSIK